MQGPSIIQAKFFLLPDAPHIKKTVRFYDKDEQLTTLALAVEMYEAQKRLLLHRLYASRNKGWLTRRMLATWCRRIDERLAQLAEQKIELTLARLDETARIGAVAVERTDRSFRPMRMEESPGLRQLGIRGVWLFVFGHDELCSNKPPYLAASAM